MKKKSFSIVPLQNRGKKIQKNKKKKKYQIYEKNNEDCNFTLNLTIAIFNFD